MHDLPTASLSTHMMRDGWRIATPHNIDLSLILRGFFACSVVFWHTLGYRTELLPVLNIPGRVAVWMFFGLSGYVIGYGFRHGRYTFNTRGLTRYGLKRAARILPLFYLLSLLAFLRLLISNQPIPLGWSDVPAQLFALQWHHSYELVGVFWTLGVELQFYLVAPVFCFFLLRADHGHWGRIMICLWLLPFLVLGGKPDDRSLLAALPHFITGLAIAWLSGTAWFNRHCGGALSLALAAIASVLALALANTVYHLALQLFWNHAGILLTDVAIASLLVVHSGIERNSYRANWIAKFLQVVGVLSYGIYAWHGLLLAFPFFETRFFELLIASMLMAYLSYLGIERPLMVLTRKAV